jgi:hypothetical protein
MQACNDTLEQIKSLKQERDRTWAAFNPKAPHSLENDWVTFALANAAWHKAYKSFYGAEPAEDLISEIAALYYQSRLTTKTETIKALTEQILGKLKESGAKAA